MASDDIYGNHNYSPDTTERREILEQTISSLVSLITAFCPGTDPTQTEAWLRNIDFSTLNEADKSIVGHMIPGLSAFILPAEADQEGTLMNAYYRNLNLADTESGGLKLIPGDGIPPSEEYLKSQTAQLRATTLFASRVCGIDCVQILQQKIPYTLAEMVLKTGNRIPASLLRKLSAEDKGLLQMTLMMESNGEDYREKEREEAIERNIREFSLSPGAVLNNPETELQIRTIIRDSIWKVWEKKEKVINNMKRQNFQAIKQFLQKYPDLSALVPWLLG